jgi:hypothetical protein
MANRDRLLPLEERMMTPWHMITINRATFTCNCEHDQAYRDFTEFAPIYHVRGLTLCEQHWKVGPQTAWELIHEHGDIQSEITRLHPETRFWTEGERLVIAPAATEYDIVAAEASLIFAGQHYEVR